MILIKSLIVFLGIISFYGATAFFLELVTKRIFKKREYENLDLIDVAGRELKKFDVDTCLIIENWPILSDVPMKERMALHQFFECVMEYKTPYIYVADKEGKQLLNIAISRDFKKAKIELHKKY